MRAVRIWLWVGVVMVLIQVMLGGITRLTESGLSIVEWNVVMGSFPPTSDAAWQQEFEKYQQSAQFEKVNTDFTVQEFKQIFWWEFIHRLWARLIGFVFLFPFIWFLFKKYFSRDWVKKLLIVFVLGGLQGFVGWIMVASGLDGDPWVDPSKLTIHLLLALMVYVYLIWLALSWQDKNLRPKNVALFNGMRWITVFVFIQIGLGGLMAGTDAGRIYTTWPLMQGQLAPEGAFSGLLTADKLVALTPEINRVKVDRCRGVAAQPAASPKYSIQMSEPCDRDVYPLANGIVPIVKTFPVFDSVIVPTSFFPATLTEATYSSPGVQLWAMLQVMPSPSPVNGSQTAPVPGSARETFQTAKISFLPMRRPFCKPPVCMPT